ncbi:UNVERIFIED_CONTAM: hypothetical protein H355_014778 [Colinus virginianus]|nr:hypothetical protein H355_014778 [Colinus virginianus]
MEPGSSRQLRWNKGHRHSCGQKDFAPDGSAEQAERLRLYLEEQQRQLAEERVARPGNLVKAVWKPEQGIVELESPAGKFWHTMGFSEHGKQCLLPEEALYLMECGSLQLFYKDVPMSIQEAYEILLSQEAMNLLHYQVRWELQQRIRTETNCLVLGQTLNLLIFLHSKVFSHLKQLGYIVLRFNPRSCEKKYKVSEDFPKAEGTCEKGGEDCGEFSCIPLDEKPLSEQLKELVTGNRAEQSVKSNPVPLDTGQKNSQSPSRILGTGDQKVSSAATHAPHWDFTSIILPNVAPDQPCIHLPSPDNKLLPENVPGREVDATSWCRRINQRKEKLSQKEREQRERESKYKSSINADREVRCCFNWQEYKALLRRRSQQRVWRRPPHLWDQAVTPLLQPEEATSSAVVLQQISVLQPSHILDGASRLVSSQAALNWLQESLESIKIDFNVYQADAVATFKKTNPGKPYVRMCVQSFDKQIPSLQALKQVTYQSGDVPVVFALVDHGEIAFYSLKEFKLPVDVNF